MRAYVLTDAGFALDEIADPEPEEGAVIVELRAAAINRRDLLVCDPPSEAYRFPRPLIPGSDGAGIRTDTGEEVVIYPGLFWGDDPRAAGRAWEILGGPSNGTYAEAAKVPVENVFPKPAWMSWAEAAAFPLANLTAFRALFTVGGLRHDETVLILGASGGVSTAAIALANVVGARTFVTTSSEEKLSRAVELGAESGALYLDDKWVQHIRELTGGEGVDLVLDSVGSTWDAALRCLRKGGRVVALGGTGGPQAALDVRFLYLNWLSILGTTMGSPHDFAELITIMERSEMRPTIDSVFALGEVVSAHDRIRSGDHFGKLILDVTR